MEQLPQRIDWHYFSCRVSSDWEVTRYDLSNQRGKLNFSTRHGHAGSISWEKTSAEYKPESMMNDFMAKHLLAVKEAEKIEEAKLQLETFEGWLLGSWQEGYPLQASRYLENEGVTLKWTFLHCTNTELENLYKPVIKSFSENNGDRKKWCLWNFGLSLPAGFKPKEVNAIPASHSMKFTGPENAQAAINRWGLTSEILKHQTLEDFSIKQYNKMQIHISEIERTTFNGHEAVKLKIKKRGEKGFDKLIGRYWDGDAILWHNKELKRIYSLRQIKPEKTQPLDLEDLI